MDRSKTLLSVPLKKPYEVDIVKPLTNLLTLSYLSSSDKTKQFTDGAAEFGKQRNTAVFKVFEKYESSLPIIYNYFDQLCALEKKIPIQELQVPFKYKDCFDKGSIFGAKASLTISSLAYEKVCTLFNIAALQSSIAQNQNFDSDEGLQQAVKLLQLSAGIFVYLKSAAPSAIPTQPTTDLSPECLSVLASLMLAQAQELFIVKLIKDKGKELLIAKLCCQCEEMYADVLKSMQKESLRNIWDKEWIPCIAGKQSALHASIYYFMSLHNRSCKQIGQEISRLQKAIELFKAAQQRAGSPTYFEDYLSKAQLNLAESRKDNDFIYNEQIPDINTLEGPGKLLIAKPSDLPTPMNKEFKDIFDSLIPVALHHALVTCDTIKNETVNAEVMKLRDATQTLNAILSSLNLPAAIENTENGASLPPSLLEKASTVRSKGGISAIRLLINELPSALERNQQILDETERMLNEERESDDLLRNQFKEKWTRAASNKLTENFRASASKYRDIINNAISADKVVRDKFENNCNGIAILSKPANELENAIPASIGEKTSVCGAARDLKELMKQVAAIKLKRDSLEAELKSTTIDLKEKFLQALAADGAISEDSLAVTEIGKMFLPLQKRIQSSLQEQENIVSEIQEKHKAFVLETGTGTSMRDSQLKELAVAYDYFMELQNNLSEGTKFYNDLTELLIVFQNKISDFCFARKTEKDELLKDLTTTSSRASMPSTPAIPAHHSNVSEATTTTLDAVSSPYPNHPNMPIPYGASSQAPYPTYMPLAMPQGFNPYATLPYPNAYQFPSAPQAYGTWPGYQGGGFPQGNNPQQPPH